MPSKIIDPVLIGNAVIGSSINKITFSASAKIRLGKMYSGKNKIDGITSYLPKFHKLTTTSIELNTVPFEEKDYLENFEEIYIGQLLSKYLNRLLLPKAYDMLAALGEIKFLQAKGKFEDMLMLNHKFNYYVPVLDKNKIMFITLIFSQFSPYCKIGYQDPNEINKCYGIEYLLIGKQ